MNDKKSPRASQSPQLTNINGAPIDLNQAGKNEKPHEKILEEWFSRRFSFETKRDGNAAHLARALNSDVK